MAKEVQGYIVAMRTTQAAGPHAGIVTWTCVESKAVFDAQFDDEMRKNYEVVEEGITQERAIELTRKTPLSSMVKSALAGSTDPKTGEVNEEHFEMKMGTIALALSMRM